MKTCRDAQREENEIDNYTRTNEDYTFPNSKSVLRRGRRTWEDRGEIQGQMICDSFCRKGGKKRGCLNGSWVNT